MSKETLFDINEMIEILQTTLEGAEDNEELQAKLNEYEAKRDDKIIAVAKWRRQLMQEEKTLWKAEADHVTRKRTALKNKAERLASYLEYAVGQLPERKLKHSLGTVYFQTNPPRFDVLDADLIEQTFWQFKFEFELGSVVEEPIPAGAKLRFAPFDKPAQWVEVWELDKKKIHDHWKRTGEAPEGIRVVQGESIRFQ